MALSDLQQTQLFEAVARVDSQVGSPATDHEIGSAVARTDAKTDQY